LPDDQPVEHSLISKSIETAQRRVEGHNFDIRKHLVEYDDVMNKQREVLYRKRRAILEFDPNSKQAWIHDGILEKMTDEEKTELSRKLKNIPEEIYMYAEKRIYMSVIDQFWVEHLNTMEQLRDSIGLRGYGQVDPLVAYKQESFTLFTRLLNSIEDEVINILNKVEFTQAPQTPPPSLPKKVKYEGAQEEDSSESIKEVASSSSTDMKKVEKQVVSRPSSGVVSSVRSVGDKMNAIVQSSQKPVEEDKVGRNDPCTCGSGKKYKKCCGK
jgi:preprotein translocase subunit SecA